MSEIEIRYTLPAALAAPIYNPTPEQLKALMEERKFVPKEIYPLVQYWSNAPTSDYIPVRTSPTTGRREFLTARRIEPPWKDEFFLLGGRIPGGHTSRSNLDLVVKRELGVALKPDGATFLGEFPCWNPQSQRGTNHGWWSIHHAYIVELDGTEFTGDGLVDRFQWFENIQEDFPEEFSRALRAAGFSTE